MVMEILLLLFLPLLLLLIAAKVLRKPSSARQNLPPGKTGLPFFGESLAFNRSNQKGEQNNFIQERVEKYGSLVFRTSLLGEQMVVMCGPAANKFLFSNEGKEVALWFPESVRRLMGPCMITKTGEEGKACKKLLSSFFSIESLTKWVATMDQVTRRHISTHWTGKEEVIVYPTVKVYTFDLACRLFMNITDPELISRLAVHFNIFLKGVIALPLNFPGARFYNAMRAADSIRAELRVLVRQRRENLDQKTGLGTEDLMSYLMSHADDNGKFMPEEEVINNMLDLLFAGHDTSSTTLTLIMKYLAELPQVHQKVMKEQKEIAAAKGPGEFLRWEDLQKMRYTWNVVCEVMRMSPPITGSFREATEDFTFEGYTIPKGWKILWSASFTHKEEKSYRRPTTFDESRFEGSGPPPFSYVPFGGGPRMCLGKELARMEILTFLHYLMNQLDWDLSIPDERIIIDPMPTPVNGLPVRLRPRNFSY